MVGIIFVFSVLAILAVVGVLFAWMVRLASVAEMAKRSLSQDGVMLPSNERKEG